MSSLVDATKGTPYGVPDTSKSEMEQFNDVATQVLDFLAITTIAQDATAVLRQVPATPLVHQLKCSYVTSLIRFPPLILVVIQMVESLVEICMESMQDQQ